MANVLIQSSAFTYSRDDDTAIWVHAGWFDADVPGGGGHLRVASILRLAECSSTWTSSVEVAELAFRDA